MSNKWGLPNGARAITVTTEIHGRKRTDTYYQNEHGLLMRSTAIGTTRGVPAGIAGGNVSLIYRNSVKRGLKFELHTQKQVDSANAQFDKAKGSDKKEIASAELHPQAGKAGYHAKKLLTTKSRARGRRL